MAIIVRNTNYSGEVLEQLLTLAATSNEIVEKGLIMVIPGVEKKISLPRLKTGKMLQKRKENPGVEDSKGKSFKTVSLCGKLGGRLYVIKTFLAQALNAEFIDWYVRMLEFVGGKTNVYCYMENNKLQDPFFQQVFKPLVAKVRREQKIALFIRGDEEKKTDKATRIEANLEPLNREGNLILNEAERDNPHMKELEDQFKLFTLTMRYPADGPDAVEGANRIIDELIRRIEPPVFRSRKDVRKRNKKRL